MYVSHQHLVIFSYSYIYTLLYDMYTYDNRLSNYSVLISGCGHEWCNVVHSLYRMVAVQCMQPVIMAIQI